MALVTFSIIPYPSDATVILMATGYSQVNNTITVEEGTEVSYVVSRKNYAATNGYYVVQTNSSLVIQLSAPSNINLITENLAELLTNSVTMTTKFYEIFIDPNPHYVTLKLYDENNRLINVEVPNRALDRKIALSGEVNPENTVKAHIGTMYVNTVTSVVYVKSAEDSTDPEGGNTGWQVVPTQNALETYFNEYLSDNGYLNTTNAEAYLTEETYMKEAAVDEKLEDFVPTTLMNTLTGSGSITLQDNSAYTITPTGAITFILPVISSTELDKLHKILVQVNMETVYSIIPGTTKFFDKIIPDLSTTGMYNLLYEYDNVNEEWVVGCIAKGA